MNAQSGTARRIPGPSVSIDLVRVLLKYASSTKADIEAAVAASGLQSVLAADTDARIPVKAFESLWKNLNLSKGDSSAGLLFGEAFAGLIEGHFLHTLIMNSRTVGNALEVFFRFHNLMSDVTQPVLTLRNDLAHIGITRTGTGAIDSRHLIEAAAAMIASLLRKLTGNRILYSGVHFSHASPNDPGDHYRIFGRHVFFKQDRNEIIFDAEVLSRNLLFPNRGVIDALTRHARELQQKLFSPHRYTREALSLIGDAILEGGDHSLPAISEKFDLGPRQLQNLLRREGSSFRGLLERVRKEIALHYVAGTAISLCEIALLLGFSDQSAFNHTFRRWTGCSPMVFRKKHASAASPG